MNPISPFRRARRLPVALLAAVSLLPLPAALAVPNAPAPRVDLRALATAKSFDQFIVKFRAGTTPQRSPQDVDAVLGRAAERAKSAFGAARRAHGLGAPAQAWQLHRLHRLGVGADVFRSSEKLDANRARLLLEQLGADPDVEYVEVDQVLHAVMTPNDTNYPDLWGMQDADAGIRADKAWDRTSGQGVVVAVIDTGYTDHSDLAANILPGYDFITDVTRANDGNGRDSDAHDPGDWSGSSASSWHGTHVSGTIAAVGNKSEGVIGAAFKAKVVPVRVLGVGGGSGSDIADGITWASGGSVPGAPVNNNPAEVLNLSLGGGGGCSATYQSAIDGAVSRGTLVVVAAGNDNLDAANGSLSTCNNVVVVGAHTSSAARASFSNYGAAVDVSGPGTSILSTLNTGSTTPGGEGYAYYQGTSMATPHVAASAALTQAYRVATGHSPYTPAQLEAQIKATAYPMGSGCSVSSGNIVDARTLVDTAGGSFKLLSDGVTKTNQTASTGGNERYAMVTTTKAQGLTFSSSGGTGNADLYVKFGSAPTTTSFDCKSTQGGNSEACSIPVAQAGTYYVLLQAASSYSGVSVTGSASGNKKPIVAYSVNSTGLTANFTDGSSDADGGVTSRTWIFGDGSTSTATNPSHSYSLAGGYTVQLTAKDASNASNCALRQVNVNPPSQALQNGVSVNNIAANTGALLPYTLAVPAGASNLHFNTSGGTGDADLYVKFGSPPTLSDFDCVSGTETTTESCVLPSATAGTWYVLVNAYSKISGVSLVGSYTGGSANHAPTANFSFTTSALTANFTDSSTDSDGSIASRSWNFGDGNTSSTANPSHTYANPGTYTVTLTVTDNGGLQNSNSKQVTVSSGGGVSISIADASITEGGSLSRKITFTLNLSAASSTDVKYNIATFDGTATAPSDYTARSLTGLSIPAGTLSKAFQVSVNGDTLAEPDETFNVALSNVTGATVADGSAVGTIINDDAGGGGGTPSLSIANVTSAEGNSGSKAFVFTVKLSAPASGNVTYNIATTNGTAMAGSDYVAASASAQVIPAGQTSKTFTVNVNGDTTLETNERFRVNVTGVTGATVGDGLAVGIITNDD
jgi:serine protease